ncbi:TetR family transcriptional regulator [Ureibacillus xyleni]|uniref:TetR family transcriptional regulator n=1 Tax=Ureibacillus xyleni TaxID=614648 RepID=A0A285SWZ4_9BACL|nr:TetR/AcrR family transcriptional regulator [Ureibacillus xyleni]SOC13144.1 TetR family transcriptional regulator [Ureibacillus xyleni]
MPLTTFFNLPNEKRTIILEGSIAEFAEHGYEKASISSIIKRVGIPRGSFYQYFEDKLDLYKYVIEQIGFKKHEYTKNAYQISSNITFIDIVKNLFIGGVQFYRLHPDMAKIATNFILNSDQELKKMVLGDGHDKSFEFFHPLINECKEKGEIDKRLGNETIILLIESLNVSFVQYFIEKSGSDYFDDHLFSLTEEIILFLEKGLSIPNTGKGI